MLDFGVLQYKWLTRGKYWYTLKEIYNCQSGGWEKV
ncbi:MAG: hypothetical protein K0R21_1524 [Anaerocolumna sp.]|nr:hypothetical protein [Anaerocolumna sp.]